MSKITHLSIPNESERGASAERAQADQAAAVSTMIAGLDTFLAAVTGPIAAARKEVNDLHQLFVQDVARLKGNMEQLVESAGRVNSAVENLRNLVEQERANRADIVNAKVRE